MTAKISFKLDLFKRVQGDAKRSRKALLILMESLARINYGYLKLYSENIPSLYDSGVVYRPERGTENWCDIPHVLKQQWGDCEDLACWRIAELRFRGVKARPWIKWNPRAKHHMVYHAVVRLPDGRVEDPSKALGMHGSPVVGKPVFISPV